MSMRPQSRLDQLVGACVSLLVAAVAVYVAVKLILAVWVVLVAIIGATTLLLAATALVRHRRGGW